MAEKIFPIQIEGDRKTLIQIIAHQIEVLHNFVIISNFVRVGFQNNNKYIQEDRINYKGTDEFPFTKPN